MRHEYLIEQVQFSENETYTEGTSIQKVTLDFNLPIKELIWVHQIAHTSLLTSGECSKFTITLPHDEWDLPH